MVDRSAVNTIRGYFYQFDRTILEILSLSNLKDTVDIECIEDIDKNASDETTAIQCKYYSSTEYNHSLIAKPIRFMLDDFSDRTSNGKPLIRYKLYGCYKTGQDKLPLRIELQFLKDHFLTYVQKDVKQKHHETLNLSDTELERFLARLDIDINAESYRQQQVSVIAKLRSQYDCNDFEAENFYYNNALAKITQLAILEHSTQRRIEKQAFIEQINLKEIFFNSWFIAFKGKKAFLADIKNRYFKLPLNASPFERFFLLPYIDETNGELKKLVLVIQKQWSNLMHRNPSSYCPYIYIHGISPPKLAELKTLLRDEHVFNVDGHDFKDAEFSAKTLSRRATSSNEIKLKFVNDLRSLDELIGSITTTKEIFQFFLDKSYYICGNPSISHQIIQVESFNDIQELVK